MFAVFAMVTTVYGQEGGKKGKGKQVEKASTVIPFSVSPEGILKITQVETSSVSTGSITSESIVLGGGVGDLAAAFTTLRSEVAADTDGKIAATVTQMKEAAAKKAQDDAVAMKALDDKIVASAAQMNDAAAKRAQEDAAAMKALDDKIAASAAQMNDAAAKKAQEDATAMKALDDKIAASVAQANDAAAKKAQDDAAAMKALDDKIAAAAAKKAQDDAAALKALEDKIAALQQSLQKEVEAKDAMRAALESQIREQQERVGALISIMTKFDVSADLKTLLEPNKKKKNGK